MYADIYRRVHMGNLENDRPKVHSLKALTCIVFYSCNGEQVGSHKWPSFGPCTQCTQCTEFDEILASQLDWMSEANKRAFKWPGFWKKPRCCFFTPQSILLNRDSSRERHLFFSPILQFQMSMLLDSGTNSSLKLTVDGAYFSAVRGNSAAPIAFLRWHPSRCRSAWFSWTLCPGLNWGSWFGRSLLQTWEIFRNLLSRWKMMKS